MMRLFLNGLAASAGGGLTYLWNVIPQLSRQSGVWTTVAVGSQLRSEFAGLPNISFCEMNLAASSSRRFWQEQSLLPDLIRRSGADVLISAGNFALRKSPVPQILLSRNSLYTSDDFFRDLRARGEYGMWLETRIRAVLARRSVHWADCTVAPSHAFADELKRWTGQEIFTVHHGFDAEAFFCDQAPLSTEVQEKLDSAGSGLRLLFVSHYNYYRNFETLLRALPLLQQQIGSPPVKLFLTCKLEPGQNPGAYRTEAAAALLRELHIRDQVVELGAVPYRSLHHVYRACDLYVTPAYAETFAHPLVEAMASGLAVVASDLPVHREICGDAALYFARFSPAELAEQVVRAQSPERRGEKRLAGQGRAQEFSWQRSVEALLNIAENYASRNREQGVSEPA
jgi:glycosyltransferase involved in cell wall biosynthesis